MKERKEKEKIKKAIKEKVRKKGKERELGNI